MGLLKRPLVGLVLTGLVLGLLAALDLRTCPFLLATGIPCPGCGLVRASFALLRGDPAEAWRLHPLVFVAVPVGVAEVAALLFPSLPRWRYPRPVILFAVVSLLAVWTLRLGLGLSPDGVHLGAGLFVRVWRWVFG